jgi:hypothetical protein
MTSELVAEERAPAILATSAPSAEALFVSFAVYRCSSLELNDAVNAVVG